MRRTPGRSVESERPALIGDPVARRGGSDAQHELPAQLRAHGAGEQAPTQQDHASHDMIVEVVPGVVRRRVGSREEHRHQEQFARCDKAREGREPEIEAQGRENDEEEIEHRDDEAERPFVAHVAHLNAEADRRHAGFEEGVEIAPQPGKIVSTLDLVCNDDKRGGFDNEER